MEGSREGKKKVIKERHSEREIEEYSERERVVIACVVYIAQASGVELEKRRGDRLKGKKRKYSQRRERVECVPYGTI